MHSINPFIRTIIATLLVVFSASAPALAQNPKLDLARFERLGADPASSVKIDIDERMIRMVVGLLDKDDPEVRDILTGMKGVHVRHYEFDAPGQYPVSEVNAIRAELQQGGWVRIVEAKSRKDGDTADVFTAMEGDRMTGLAIVVSNPKEVTVVNIIGVIDPAKLRHLGGKMGIPTIDIGKLPGKEKQQ
jgi:hypothetical protein